MTAEKKEGKQSQVKIAGGIVFEKKELEQPMTESAEPQNSKPFDEFLGRAQKAYSAYLDAQKEIWVAYRETEQQTEETYIKAEAGAYAVLNSTLETAAQTQKLAEKQAEDAYQAAKEQARMAYEQVSQQAMNEFNSTVKQAWEKRKAALAQAWSIFIK